MWKTYPHGLWINQKILDISKKTELSTVIVDNSVENCAEVQVVPLKVANKSRLVNAWGKVLPHALTSLDLLVAFALRRGISCNFSGR